MKIGSLFSGIGGLELGLEEALRDAGYAVETAWQCEADEWCRGVLARHWPSARRFDDVRTLGPDAGSVDILCGGFPCQDLSYAGRGAGLAGERSGLWREFARVIRDLRPRVIVVENVAALLSRGVGDVLGDLAALGYDALWQCVRAADAGAPHRRDRLFIVAWRSLGDAAGARRAGDTGREGAGARRISSIAGGADADVADSRSERLEGLEQAGTAPRAAGRIGRKRAGSPRAQRGLGRGADGLPRGLDAHQWPAGRGEPQHAWEPPRTTTDRHERRQRLKALGNAVVPQVAYAIGCVVAEVLRREGER